MLKSQLLFQTSKQIGNQKKFVLNIDDAIYSNHMPFLIITIQVELTPNGYDSLDVAVIASLHQHMKRIT
jgi:hypothetical protein